MSGLQPREIAGVFREWNAGDLESYLIEITAKILEMEDRATGRPLVDVVLDAAGQKGTGAWSAINAMEMGVATPSIAEAVFARSLSALKEERVRAAGMIKGPAQINRQSKSIAAICDALYCSKVCAYAQGFAQMAAASKEYGWNLDLASIARIWRGGCIIRARVLQQIANAFARDRGPANLLVDPRVIEMIAERQAGWREVVAMAALQGVPAPAFGSSLSYYDSYRSASLPTNLIQAQRDFFGGHGFERINPPRGQTLHLNRADSGSWERTS
jgi:6-phosphogluconate dehydrogenase